MATPSPKGIYLYNNRLGAVRNPIKATEYVILSTPEEDALNNYFLMLSRFAFDTARDQAVREVCMMQLVPL